MFSKLKLVLNNERGAALVVVLIITAVASIFAFTVLATASSDIRQTVIKQNFHEGQVLARSAVQLAEEHFLVRFGELKDAAVEYQAAIDKYISEYSGADPITYPITGDGLDLKAKSLRTLIQKFGDELVPGYQSVSGVPSDKQMRLNLDIEDKSYELDVMITGTRVNDPTGAFITSKNITFTCTVTGLVDGTEVNAIAKRRVGDVSFAAYDFLDKSKVVEYITYSWGDTRFVGGGRPDDVSKIVAGGKVYSNNATAELSGATKDMNRPIGLITPSCVHPTALSNKAWPTGNTISLNNDSSGYYSLTNGFITNNTRIDVDVANGNVVLVLDKLVTRGTVTFNVYNSNPGDKPFYLYLFVQEPWTTDSSLSRKTGENVLSFQNGLQIDTGFLDADKNFVKSTDPNREVLTYIIVYNDTSQMWVSNNWFKDNTKPRPPVPTNESGNFSHTAVALSGAPSGTSPANLDGILLNNGGGAAANVKLDAHIYAPFCQIWSASPVLLRGSITAASIGFANNNNHALQNAPATDMHVGPHVSFGVTVIDKHPPDNSILKSFFYDDAASAWLR